MYEDLFRVYIKAHKMIQKPREKKMEFVDIIVGHIMSEMFFCLGYPCQRSDLSIRYSYCLYKDKINVAFDLLNKGSVSI